MAKLFIGLFADESGATAIEYGLIIAVVSAAGISAFQWFGNSLSDIFLPLSADLNAAADGIGTGIGYDSLARADQAPGLADCRQLSPATITQTCDIVDSR